MEIIKHQKSIAMGFSWEHVNMIQDAIEKL